MAALVGEELLAFLRSLLGLDASLHLGLLFMIEIRLVKRSNIDELISQLNNVSVR
jgi:hypothetical protein